MNADKLTIPEGFSVDVGSSPQGWFAGVLVRPDRDKPFVEDLGEIESMKGARLKPGQTDEAWLDAMTGPVGLQIVLAEETAEGNGKRVLTEADHIWGPAAANSTESGPLLSWTEKRDGRWWLIAWQQGTETSVASSAHVLREPAVAEWNGAPVTACQPMPADGPQVALYDSEGNELFVAEGRCPHLATAGDRLYLVYEEPASDSCRLQCAEFLDGKCVRHRSIPAGGDLNLNADLLADPETGALYVVHEAAPAWGHDHFLGRHRDLWMWRLDSGTDRFVAAPGELPIPLRASHDLNEPPVQPRALLLDGQPAVVFRRFEYYAARPFSWHVYLIRFDGYTWSDPRRISDDHGFVETDYGVMGEENELVAALTCCDQRPPLTREDLEAGREPRGMPGRVHNTFVTVKRLPADADHGPVPSLPNRLPGEYHVSLGVRDVAPDPELNAPVSAPEKLIWGDLHQHTLWSKCMSPVDGTRSENLRYQRDVLGCRVFSFGEHTTMMSDSEFTYYLDQLEAEAGADGVAMYGTEPWSGGHDTNLYAIDRGVFQRLRQIYQRHRHLGAILEKVKEEFTDREVACLRHFHGGGEGIWSTKSPEVVNTHIPEVEPAMEAMQIRGNVFMGETDAHEGLPAFPVNFLNAGCKVGLVGGTDHSSDPGPNHFCLTGFWVDEVTPEAVWDALWNRKTIALSNGKIAIWAECAGQAIGEKVRVEGPLKVTAWLSSARPITRVTLVRDGKILGWREIGGKEAEVELVDENPLAGEHWYSVTAEAESSPDLPRPVLGHASPFFVEVPVAE